MSKQIKLIAQRIKELREIKNLSVSEAAQLLNITKEEYAKYENGDTDIPIGFLYKLAGEYKVDLTEILTGESPRLKTYTVTRKGQGKSIERTKYYDYKSLAYNFVHKKAEPFIVSVEPKDEKLIPQNSHPGQEFNYIIEGKIKIIIDGHEIILEEGDSVYFDSSKIHGMKALDGKKAIFLAIIF